MGRQSHLRGYTLVETVLSLAITAILLGAMTSLVVVASRSIPGRGGAADSATAASAFLEQFAADIAAARVINLASDRAIDVSVGDRDADGKLEEIRYEWSGEAGSSIDRIYNNIQTSLNISAEDFSLGYEVTDSTKNSASVVTSFPESKVGSFTTLLTLAGRQVDTAKSVAQHFVPTLPAGTRSWTVTRVTFSAQGDLLAATGTTEVQLRTVGADGKPTGSILASATVAESSLSLVQFAMTTVTFTNVPPLAPDQEIAVVFNCNTNCPSMSVGFASLGVGRPQPMSTYSGTWTSSSTSAIPHEVYATTTRSTAAVASTRSVGRVNVELRVPKVATPLRTTIVLPNAPEVQ